MLFTSFNGKIKTSLFLKFIDWLHFECPGPSLGHEIKASGPSWHSQGLLFGHPFKSPFIKSFKDRSLFFSRYCCCVIGQISWYFLLVVPTMKAECKDLLHFVCSCPFPPAETPLFCCLCSTRIFHHHCNLLLKCRGFVCDTLPHCCCTLTAPYFVLLFQPITQAYCFLKISVLAHIFQYWKTLHLIMVFMTKK